LDEGFLFFMGDFVKSYFKRIISLILCAALVWTTGEGAQAAPYLFEPIAIPSTRFWPQVVRPVNDPAYFTEQAIVQSLTNFLNSTPRDSTGFQYEKEGLGTALSERHSIAFPSMLRTKLLSPEMTFIYTSLVAILHAAIQFPKNGYQMSTAALLYILSFHSVDKAIRMLMGERAGFNPNVLSCGNFLVSGKYTLDQIAELLTAPGGPIQDLINRGIYSFGFWILIPVKQKIPKEVQIPGFETANEEIVWEYRIGKVALMKRDDALVEAKAEIKKQVKLAFKDADHMPEYIQIAFHSRLGSVGSDDETLQELEDSAQPGMAPPRGEPDDWQLQQVAVMDGETPRMIDKYVKGLMIFQLNGDLGGATGTSESAPKEPPDAQWTRDRFMRWLGYKTAPLGDAFMEAFREKMYRTEQLWDASIRYSLLTYVAHPGDSRDMNPPLQLIDDWNVFFQHAFKKWVRNRPEVALQWLLNPKTDEEKNEIFRNKLAHADQFRAYLSQIIEATADRGKARREFLQTLPETAREKVTNQLIEGIKEYMPDKAERDSFLKNATLAYWRNSLEYAALVEMKKRKTGTEAADHASTLDPYKRVNTSQGQGLVFAFAKDGAGTFIASDRIVFAGMPEKMASDMFNLDSSKNESVVTAWSPEDKKVHISVYRGINNDPVPPSVVREKMKAFADRRGRDQHEEDPAIGGGELERGVRRTVIQLNKINQEGQAIRRGRRTRNLIPRVERTRVMMQRRIYDVLMRYLLANGLPIHTMDAWAWREADRLSRDAWWRLKSEQEILNDIRDLARSEAENHHSLPPEELKIDFETLNNRYDEVVIGTGKTKYALFKSALALNRSIGWRTLVLSGNEFLEKANKYQKDVDGLLRELGTDRHASFRIASDSGAETYDLNIDADYLRVLTEEPFGVAGTRSNKLVDLFGEERVEVTDNAGTKDQDGIAANTSMIQTFEESDLFAAEAVTSRFRTGGSDWMNGVFFKTPFTHEEVTQLLVPSNDDFVRTVPETLLGYTARGDKLDTSSGANPSAKLREEGLKGAGRQQEASRKWLFVMGFILLTVGIFGHGLFGTLFYLYHIKTGFVFGWRWQFLIRPLDVLTYWTVGLTALLLKRYIYLRKGWSDTKVLAGFGVPSYTFLSQYIWVQGTLRDYARVAQGLAFYLTKSAIYDANLEEMSEQFRASMDRNSVIWIFGAGPRHEAYKFNANSTDQAGRHGRTNLSIPLPT
jgi:hypothetical protein